MFKVWLSWLEKVRGLYYYLVVEWDDDAFGWSVKKWDLSFLSLSPVTQRTQRQRFLRETASTSSFITMPMGPSPYVTSLHQCRCQRGTAITHLWFSHVSTYFLLLFLLVSLLLLPMLHSSNQIFLHLQHNK